MGSNLVSYKAFKYTYRIKCSNEATKQGKQNSHIVEFSYNTMITEKYNKANLTKPLSENSMLSAALLFHTACKIISKITIIIINIRIFLTQS